MRKFIISSVLCLSALWGYGQEVSHDSLLRYEYLHYGARDSVSRNDALVSKFNVFVKGGVINEQALSTVRRVNHRLITDKEAHAAFLWNALIVSYVEQAHDYGAYLLGEYRSETADTSTAFLLLTFLINKYHDTTVAQNAVRELIKRDTVFKGLGCFAVRRYEKKHRSMYLLSSAVVPGAGTMMNGYILKGLTSLVVNGSAVFGIVKLVESGLYLNAVLWGTGAGLKFYTGNIRLTGRTFEWAEDKKRRKINDECEARVRYVLSRYPIGFKDLRY